MPVRKKYALVFLLLLCPAVFPGLLAAGSSILPDYLDLPVTDISHSRTFTSAAQLEQFFGSAGYTLEQVREEKQIPRLYVANLPSDLKKSTASQRTSLFIRLLLPTTTSANNQILAIRSKLELLAERKAKGTGFSASEQQWLSGVATDYQASPDDLQELLNRADFLPAGLVLAQAIDESGWGTSYFAITNSALFGQHLLKGTRHPFILLPESGVRVATFANLYQSVASYLHNLNTNRAYARLRAERAAIRQKYGKLSGSYLAGALIHYSDRGQAYVTTLRKLIRKHQLDELDNLQIDSNGTTTLIKFKR